MGWRARAIYSGGWAPLSMGGRRCGVHGCSARAVARCHRLSCSAGSLSAAGGVLAWRPSEPCCANKQVHPGPTTERNREGFRPRKLAGGLDGGDGPTAERGPRRAPAIPWEGRRRWLDSAAAGRRPGEEGVKSSNHACSVAVAAVLFLLLASVLRSFRGKKKRVFFYCLLSKSVISR
jgi:hypothetical protein